VEVSEKLTYYQTMVAGAVSRTCAQTLMHPANTYKTLLQLRGSSSRTLPRLTMERLLRGADAQFVMSLPHGALYFCVIEQAKVQISRVMPEQLNLLADFAASTVSTTICSIVSTPQMVLTDRLMADVYPSFPAAVSSILRNDGVMGFYAGWWPALVQKIPSYGLTWMFFQDFKTRYNKAFDKKPSNQDNFLLGALAAAGATTVMIPMDTVKTRLVTQAVNTPLVYKGVMDCFVRIIREEGPKALYRSLPARLLSVVPMIAIQLGVYEFMKERIIMRRRVEAIAQRLEEQRQRRERYGNILRTATGRRRRTRVAQQAELGLDFSALGLANVAIASVDEAIRSFGDTLGEIQHGVVVEVENVRQGVFRERKKIPESIVNSGLLEDMERLGSEMEGYAMGFEEEGGCCLMQGKSWLLKTVATSTALLRTVGPFSTVIPSSSPGTILVPVK
jgi:solute carrier family 25 S-adenosylmethionine transporter 26